MFRYVCIITSLLFVSITGSFAEKAVKGLSFSQGIAACLSPSGLLFTTKFYYTVPLIQKEGILWESTKLDVGFNNEFAPAFEAPGLFIRLEPIAFFELSLSGAPMWAYKGLGFGCITMGSYSSDYTRIDSYKQHNQQSWWLRCTPVLKMAIKKLIAVDALAIHYFRVNGKNYYLERFNNVIIDNKDVVVNNDVYLLYEWNKAFLSGFNYTYQTVPSTDQERSHRLSLAGMYKKKLSPKFEFNAALIAGVYLKHSFYDYSNPYLGLQLEGKYGVKR